MFKLFKKKKRPARVITTTRELALKALTDEEYTLLNKRPVAAETARKGDVIETASGLFLVID